MKPKSCPRYHKLDQSPFYKLSSKKKLARLLYSSREKIKELSSTEDLYYVFDLPNERTGKIRKISAPRADLKLVQKRIADLLQRVVPPDFLFSPVKGRSYVDNASIHRGANSVCLLDIADFYPSCRQDRVKSFFQHKLKCSADVAAILRNLTCFKTALPQGSPCSPILAFLAYSDMWEELDEIARDQGCVFTAYVDDLTVSGKNVSPSLIWRLKLAMHNYGHRTNKRKERLKYQRPAEITGVVLRADSLHPPNRQRLLLAKALEAQRAAAHNADGGTSFDGQVRSRKSQISQIVSRNS